MEGLGRLVLEDRESLNQQGRVIVRRFTDQLTVKTPLATQLQRSQVESDKQEEDTQRKRLKLLYGSPESNQPSYVHGNATENAY